MNFLLMAYPFLLRFRVVAKDWSTGWDDQLQRHGKGFGPLHQGEGIITHSLGRHCKEHGIK